MRRLRSTAAALLLDVPTFERHLRGRWERIRNRGEQLTPEPGGRGVRCEWKWTSSLRVCELFPGTASRLMQAALRDWPIEFADAPPSRDAPEVSFLIGHRGLERLPLLLLTLRTIAAQRGAAVECIVVEQSAVREIEHALPSWVRYVHQPVEPDAPYSRARTFNEAARVARARLLVLHDNDMLVPMRYAAELAAKARAGDEVLDLKRFVFYLTPEVTARVIERGVLPPEARSESVVANLRGGSTGITADAYAAIGGFDETFVGWGGEDVELWERAETRRANRFGYFPLVHLWHAPQREKTQGASAPAVERYYELAKIPVAERIARLRSRNGDD
ncbi:MAG TPA: galactosyltransferase-related protein [Thermoanaerobaculia bacterium]